MTHVPRGGVAYSIRQEDDDVTMTSKQLRHHEETAKDNHQGMIRAQTTELKKLCAYIDTANCAVANTQENSENLAGWFDEQGKQHGDNYRKYMDRSKIALDAIDRGVLY